MHLPQVPSSAVDKVLTGKYPAKLHFDRVLSYLRTKDNPAISSGDGIIFLESAKAKLWPHCDQEQPFRQSRFFYYLTGCELPDCAILYIVKTQRSVLFIPPVNSSEVIWSGLPLEPKAALETYDVDDVQTSDTLKEYLNGLQLSGSTIWTIDSNVFEAHNFAKLGARNSLSLQEAIEEARVIKDDFEIALTRKANAVSDKAHRAVLRAAKTANNERELAGIFIQTCISQGCPNQAYSPIVASGTDAATLHYVHNNKGITGKTLNLLLDAGAEYDCYASDVTRTFPINGEFTKESAEIYNLVLQMQTECMSHLKAGVKWDEVHELAHKVAIEGLLKLGILKGDAADIHAAKTSTGFFPHGLGHYLGMDTHDTGGHPNYADEDPMFRYLRVRGALPAGSIITVEPGIYFCEFILDPMLKDPKHSQHIAADVLEKYWTVGGVRIEDDVLITHQGFENLTIVPKKIEDIQALMSQ